MYDTEELCLDPEDIHIVNVDGTAVPAFEYAGRMWYQLAALFRALELQEAGYGGLSARAGNLICDSGEALKYKDTWYGTIKGLHIFADRLHKDQCLYVNSIYEETAGIRYQAIMQWLSSVAGADVPNGDEKLPQREDGAANDTPSSAEAATEGNVPPDAVQDAEAAMCAAKSPMVSDGPVARAMMDNLLARVDSLCGVFGIDRSLPRDEKLVHIVWLLVFHGHDSVDFLLRVLNAANRSVSGDLRDAAEGIMEPEIFLLWCKQWSHVEDLVKAAMMA